MHWSEYIFIIIMCLFVIFIGWSFLVWLVKKKPNWFGYDEQGNKIK